MQVPLEVSFQHLSQQEHDRAEELVLEQVRRLERFARDIIACRVAVSREQEQPRTGSPYRVRIDLTIPPHHELVVSKEPGDLDKDMDLRPAIREAFHAMERQVKSTVERRRYDIKHSPEPVGLVVRLFRESGYGFIQTADGDELYFHRNSVLHKDFDRIRIGTAVRFTGEVGDKGPQASSVQIVDKPGVRRMRDGEAEESVPPNWKP